MGEMRIFQEYAKITEGAVDTSSVGQNIQKVGMDLGKIAFDIGNRNISQLAKDTRLQIQTELSQSLSYIQAKQIQFQKESEKFNFDSDPSQRLLEYYKEFGPDGIHVQKIKELVKEQTFAELQPHLTSIFLKGQIGTQDFVQKRRVYNGQKAHDVADKVFFEGITFQDDAVDIKSAYDSHMKINYGGDKAQIYSIEEFEKKKNAFKNMANFRYMIAQIKFFEDDGEYDYAAMIEAVNNKEFEIKNLDGAILDVNHVQRKALATELKEFADNDSNARKSAEEANFYNNIGNHFALLQQRDNAITIKEKADAERKLDIFYSTTGRNRNRFKELEGGGTDESNREISGNFYLLAEYALLDKQDLIDAFQANLIERNDMIAILNLQRTQEKYFEGQDKKFIDNASKLLLTQLAPELDKSTINELSSVVGEGMAAYQAFAQKNNINTTISENYIKAYALLVSSFDYLKNEKGLTIREITSNTKLLKEIKRQAENKDYDEIFGNTAAEKAEIPNIFEKVMKKGENESAVEYENKIKYYHILAQHPELKLKSNKRTRQLIQKYLGYTPPVLPSSPSGSFVVGSD
jgi:chaperonin cofactor prefoldin